MGELRFDGRSVIVTGAGRGLGRAHARLLADRGASVVVADTGASVDGTDGSEAPADEVVEEIRRAGGRAVACSASVATAEGAAAIVGTAVDSFGRIDAVVNNAGISDKHLFADLSDEQFRRMLDVHLFGTLHVTRAAWSHFVAAGYGRIVNTVSEGMLGAQPMLTSYGTAKGGVWGFTRTLAIEAAGEQDIRVNAVAPRALTRMLLADARAHAGGVDVDGAVAEALAHMDPALVSPVAAFLAHETCPINGEVLVAGGGRVMRLAPVRTSGITRDHLTLEDVADGLDQVMDPTGAVVVPVDEFT